MAEPPANWDQQDDDHPTIASTTNRLGGLNVNAMEFVPSFGSGFSFAPKSQPSTVPQPTVPKTPPSTPVVPRMTTEENNKQQSQPTVQTMEVNNEPAPKEPLTTAGDAEFDEFADEENDKVLDENTATSKASTTTATTTTAVPKEKKTIVKRDIVRKKEPLNIIFCGHVDAGKSTIGGQLM